MSESNSTFGARSELAGKAWAELAQLIDLQLSPLGLFAIDALTPGAGETILDVGCGTGQSALQLADRVGASGRVIGVDISPWVLEVARKRAANRSDVEFIESDASLLKLPDESLDGVFSRFGVMAFQDPIGAFANFRRMMKPTARLAFVCWRSLRENELDFLPLRAAGLDERVDLTPFSFAEADAIRATLTAAGFRQIAIDARDEMVSSGDLEAMLSVLLRVGPLGRITRENPDMRATAEPRVRAALARRGNQTAVALNAATWVVTARP